jgi:FHS family L-fucose permease-like MFS transporter
MKELDLNEVAASDYYLISLVLFMLSRFLCTWLMRFISPSKLLLTLSAIAIMACLLVIYHGGLLGVYALVSISGCMSLMYPTIFGLAIKGLKDDTKIASSGLVMAILGGAVLTPLQGLISDTTQNINDSFFMPLISFCVISVYAMLTIKAGFLKNEVTKSSLLH